MRARIIDLLDPDLLGSFSQEANADVFVSWDALELPTIGESLWAYADELTRPHAVESWHGGIIAEREFWRLVQRLPATVQSALMKEIVQVTLEPITATLPPPWGVGPAQTWHDHSDPTWAAWAAGVGQLQDQLRSGVVPDDYQIIFTIDGLYGRNTGLEHNIPIFRHTTWGELLQVMQWIALMAWLDYLRHGGT